MIYICAGNEQEASYYARKRGIPPRKWRYMHDHGSLAGIIQCTVLLVGGWMIKHDERSTKEFIQARRCWYIEDRDF